MRVTLVPLALMGLFGGLVDMPASWGGSMRLSGLLAGYGGYHAGAVAHGWTLQAVAAAVAVSGILAAHYAYAVYPDVRVRISARYAGLSRFLYSGWRLDGLYRRVFTAPYARMAGLLRREVDEGVIDRGFDGAGGCLARAGAYLGSAATGRVSTYILAVMMGAAGLLLYLAWGVG